MFISYLAIGPPHVEFYIVPWVCPVFDTSGYAISDIVIVTTELRVDASFTI